ncbi:MAG: Ig-like domain-containing protein, partial [Bacillus sp. (in: firmicutes)]
MDRGNVTQEETILIGEDGTLSQGSGQILKKDENLVTELAKSIKVSNNSNHIKVSAVLTDRAGYEKREERIFSIDKTAPVIEVTYDNNSYDKEFESETQYYKEGRTATITVTERNFNEEDAKVTATNSDGSAPVISGWTKHENKEEPDQTTYTATISYQEEGDYTFAMSFEDLAGHQAVSIPQQEFTVDKTAPVIEVTYDNNQVQSEAFYKEGRTATVTIKEHNFETSRIKTVLKTKDGGAVPGISAFSSNGDVHTATIRFEEDQVYTFDIDYTDKAGNQAADMQEITFCVDKTKPALSVTGIKNHSANRGRDQEKKETKVGFVLEASDENFASLTPHLKLVTLEGIKNCDDLLGSAQPVENGQRYTVGNLKKDGIYILTAAVTDKAGNENKAARVT